jgi:hypothetical protein
VFDPDKFPNLYIDRTARALENPVRAVAQPAVSYREARRAAS